MGSTSSAMTAFSQGPGRRGRKRKIGRLWLPHDHAVPTRYSRKKHVLRMMDVSSSIQFVAQTYSNALLEHPFLTKATTGFFLCGLGDVLAQVRGFQSASSSSLEGAAGAGAGAGSSSKVSFWFLLWLERINLPRLARFALKGFFGTSIWAIWYDLSDHILSEENILSAILWLGFTEMGDALLNVIRTVVLVLAEQFITCPLIYGLWEIPMSTLLNGAPASRITYEVKDKLVDMLVENAKLWTFANILIYNVPLQYRTGLANIMDVIWQSIVADFAAKCGNENDGVNVVNGVPVSSKEDQCRSGSSGSSRNVEQEELVVVMRDNVDSIATGTASFAVNLVVGGEERVGQDVNPFTGVDENRSATTSSTTMQQHDTAQQEVIPIHD